MLVLVVTVVASAQWLPPLQARSVTKDAAAAALYAANYRFAAQGTNYLAAGTPPSPLQHYWSLGVEEQFYLIWPVLLLGAALAVRRHARTLLPAVTSGLVLIAVASFAWSLHLTQTSPPWAFFSLPTRGWELAAGGLVALTAPWLRRIPGQFGTALGWAGLATVVCSCLALSGSTPFPGVAALAPVLGTVAVVAAGCSTARIGAHVLLGRRPFQAVGRMSYSWYLWHWPVLILAPAIAGHPLNLAGRLLAVTVSAALAQGTLVLVENPIRFAPRLGVRPRRGLALGAALSAAAVVCSLATAMALPSLAGQPGGGTDQTRRHRPHGPNRAVQRYSARPSHWWTAPRPRCSAPSPRRSTPRPCRPTCTRR